MKSRPLPRLACLLLAILLGMGAIQAAEASVRIVFRFAVLSWDNPATQLFDELVCETSAPSRAGAEAGHGTRLAVRASSRLVSDSVAPHLASPALSSGITRAPPAV
jgi:hypothetical protein